MDFPRTLEMRCLFHGQYHVKYQRNNKRCGFKNLRCFPYCGPNGEHHEQGFCGAPVTVDVSLSSTGPSQITLDSLHAWGEFVQRDATPRYTPGMTFNRGDIAHLLRTDAERNNPLFESSEGEEAGGVYAVRRAKLGAEGKRQFSFHSHKMGYHYGWVGNKHSTNQEHSFCVYVATEIAPDVFQCLGAFHSSAFTIYCRRRHKTVTKEEKEALATPVPEYIVSHSLEASGRLAGTPAVVKHQDSKPAVARRRFMGEMGECCVEDLVQAKRMKSGGQTTSSSAGGAGDGSSALLLSLSTGPVALDFRWMLEGGAICATYSSTARARAMFLASSEFIESLKSCLRARSFSKFVSLIRKRTDEIAGLEGAPSVSSSSKGGVPLESPDIKAAFAKLCDSFHARQTLEPSKATAIASVMLPSSALASDESASSSMGDEDDLLAGDDLIIQDSENADLLAEELDFLAEDQSNSNDLVLDEFAESLFSF